MSKYLFDSFKWKDLVKKVVLFFSLALPATFRTQTILPSFDANKKATVSERIGVCDVVISFNRPQVKGREGKIWGQLVHYGFRDLEGGEFTSKASPWRAGANENTTIEFSTAALIENKPLPAGKYGFFIALYPDKATLIFSKRNTAWGSFYYDEKEDALRVDIKTVRLMKV
jgi:hypothetical protein